jgi:hypothetical protein
MQSTAARVQAHAEGSNAAGKPPADQARANPPA